MSAGWFVTGTDTGIGKTRVAAAMLRLCAAQGKRAVGMKPVVSGAVLRDGLPVWEDVEDLQAAGNVEADLALRNPYRFMAPLAPHIAAQRAGVSIYLKVIHHACAQLRAQADIVVAEGAGGWYVPIDAHHTMADVARVLGFPVVLVVGMRLGCINHAILSAQAIRHEGLHLAGWVANQLMPDMPALADNLSALNSRLSAPLLGVLPWQPDAAPERVAACLQGTESWL